MQKTALSWLIKAADAKWVTTMTPPEEDPAIDWIAAVPDEVRPGCLYLELQPGTAKEAVKNGAAAVITDLPPMVKPYPFPCAVVQSTPYEALCRIAAWYRRQFHTRIITIAGGDGKTTVREMLYRILSAVQKTSRTRWELTGDLGVPETLLGLDSDDRTAVIEMGNMTPGSFERLGNICRPSAAIINGVGSAHLGSYGSRDRILAERLSLTKGMDSTDPIILCGDYPMLYDAADRLAGDVFYYGIDNQCDINGRIVRSERDQSILDITCYGKTTRITIHLPGKGNCYNALAAFTAASLMGVPEETIKDQLEKFRPLPGRLSMMKTDLGTTIIDDSWTSTPESMKEASAYFAQFKAKRKIAVIGDMEDLGAAAEPAYRAAGRRMAQAGADLILVSGDCCDAVKEGAEPFARTRVLTFESPEAIAQYLRTDRKSDDVLLFKAGRRSHFERIIHYVYHDQGLRRLTGSEKR